MIYKDHGWNHFRMPESVLFSIIDDVTVGANEMFPQMHLNGADMAPGSILDA